MRRTEADDVVQSARMKEEPRLNEAAVAVEVRRGAAAAVRVVQGVLVNEGEGPRRSRPSVSLREVPFHALSLCIMLYYRTFSELCNCIIDQVSRDSRPYSFHFRNR